MTSTRLGLIISIAFLSACVTDGEVRESKTSSEDAARYNLELGAAYIRQGKLELALNKLRSSIEQNSRVPEAHTTIAILYEQLDQIEKAEQHYKTALRLKANDAATLNIYGVFLCRHRSFDKAKRYFDDAVKDPLFRNSEAAYTNAGVCARRSGELAVAEEYLRKGLAVNPNYAEALLQMADLSHERENHLQARAFLQRYLDNGRVDSTVLWLGVRIEGALGDDRAVEAFESRLKREFPESLETRQLIESQRDAA